MTYTCAVQIVYIPRYLAMGSIYCTGRGQKDVYIFVT